MVIMIANKMSSSLKLNKKEGKGSKRFLQPPTLNTFDIMSSQDREEFYQDKLDELSNVEEKSYFQSEPEEPDKNDIKEFLGKMEKLDKEDQHKNTEHQFPIKRASSKSQRLQDQEIIVVEEENQGESNYDGKESVILEHIDFNEEPCGQNTPEWDQPGRQKTEDKNQYVINCIGLKEPAWIAQDQQNISNSSPRDFQSSEYKLSHNRNSKNTCFDKPQLFDSQNNINNLGKINRSCIAKPMRSMEDSEMSPPFSPQAPFDAKEGDKFKNIRNILSKWNDQIYPRLEDEYLDVHQANLRKDSEAISEADGEAKFCISKYDQGSAFASGKDVFDLHHTQSKQREERILTESISIQTELKGSQMSAKQHQEMQIMKIKIQKLQQDNARMKEKAIIDGVEMSRLRETLQNKNNQLEGVKFSFSQTQSQSQQSRKFIQESRRLQNRNKQLQKKLNLQSDALKRSQQKNEQLQNKLTNTISYYNSEFADNGQNSPTFFNCNKIKSMQLQRFDTFNDLQKQKTQIHLECRRTIEQLQEYIFDIQQKIAGFDIEVEKKVRVIGERIQLEVKKRCQDQYKTTTAQLREELTKIKDAFRLSEEERRELNEKWGFKENQIRIRQVQVNRMYEELVAEWRQIEKEKEKTNSRWRGNYPPTNLITSPKSTFQQQVPQRMFDMSRRVPPTNQSPTGYQNYYFSSKDLGSPFGRRQKIGLNNYDNNHSVQYLQKEDSFYRADRKPNNRPNDTDLNVSYLNKSRYREQNKWSRKQTATKGQPRENNQLTAINNKIQRLRKQINKELDGIH